MLAGTAANADVVFNAVGFSGPGTPINFQATLNITGNVLTITLANNSTQSLNPADLLSSFYFDIVNGANARPTLTYVSAVGDVYLGLRTATDTLQTAGANLVAVNPGDDTWQYRDFTATIGQSPFMAFGVSTVGNNGLTPNNFNGNITGAINYSIYAGDISTQNLNNTLLVRGPIVFTFTGVSGFTEADIRNAAVFGLGTGPDSLFHVPAPGSAAMLGVAALAATRRRR